MPVNPKAKRDAERKKGGDRHHDEDRDERRPRGGASAEGRRVVERAVGNSGNLRGMYDRLLEVSAGYADELAELREQRRELRSELAEFTADGVVVLTPDEAKQWTAYTALGKPDDVKKLVDSVPELQTKVTAQERRTDAAKAAELLGWKNTEAAVGLILDKKLNITFVDGQDKDGKAIKIPHVKPDGADDKVQPAPLKTWQEQNAGYLSSALMIAPAPASGGQSQGGPHGGARTGGTQMVEQGGANRSTAQGGAAGTQGQTTPAVAAVPGLPTYKSPGMRAAETKK